MHFSKVFAILSFSTGIIASPALNSETTAVFELHKRTCGTLSGIALKVCQTACKATCNAVTATLAKEACKAACEAGPLKVRTLEPEMDSLVEFRSEPEPEQESELESATNTDVAHVSEIQKRTCGTLTGTPLKVCQTACKAACTLVTGALAKEACTTACDAGPLRVRTPEPEPKPEPEPSIGSTVCKAACAVTCNSTVLALAQKKCLEVCNSKC